MRVVLSTLALLFVVACGGPESVETEPVAAPEESAIESSEAALAGVCQGGPTNGWACLYHSDCGMYCESGPNQNSFCTTGDTCGKTCAGGTMAGAYCLWNSDCPGSYCVQHYCRQIYCG